MCTGRKWGIRIQSTSPFVFVPRDTDEFEFFDLDLVDEISPPFRIRVRESEYNGHSTIWTVPTTPDCYPKLGWVFRYDSEDRSEVSFLSFSRLGIDPELSCRIELKVSETVECHNMPKINATHRVATNMIDPNYMVYGGSFLALFQHYLHPTWTLISDVMKFLERASFSQSGPGLGRTRAFFLTNFRKNMTISIFLACTFWQEDSGSILIPITLSRTLMLPFPFRSQTPYGNEHRDRYFQHVCVGCFVLLNRFWAIFFCV